MLNSNNRYRPAAGSLVAASAAALIMTASEPVTAFARSTGSVSKQVVSSATATEATDLSARRRYRRHYGNPAAGLAIMGAMIGTIGAIAAHQHDDEYDYGPGYYAGPGYYGPPPVYYAPHPYYYGRPYYGPHVRYYYGY